MHRCKNQDDCPLVGVRDRVMAASEKEGRRCVCVCVCVCVCIGCVCVYQVITSHTSPMETVYIVLILAKLTG